MKKILFYNWIPFDEKEGKGGGVTVYTRNLIQYFAGKYDYQIYFLSSGRTYDLLSKQPRIRKTENVFGDKCNSFEIVNSPVFSSAKISFPFPDRILNDESLLKVISDFIISEGGFDVIHFQNFEGLSVSVFKLKELFPETKLVYSLHNYFLFCPQVMLWREDRFNCNLGKCGQECFMCMPKDVFSFKVRINQYADRKISEGVGSAKKLFLTTLKNGAAKIAGCIPQSIRFNEKTISRLGKDFLEVQEKNVSGVNECMDAVLAVSERVRDIAVSKGIKSSKLVLSYIGTAVAERQSFSQKCEFNGGVLRICYLGYMRSMKGFYFLLDSLEQMPERMASQIEVVIASPFSDKEACERLETLKTRFAGITLYDGYSHDMLDRILDGVHLGIVPPLWEDNLPQVAIEMKSMGVAVLASDLGGAKELSGAGEFVFKAGDREDFYTKIYAIMQNPSLFDRYWEKQMRLVTMEEHICQLEEVYSSGKSII